MMKMKLFNTITASLLLCAGLASCEMKDELQGGSTSTSDMGYLELGVAVNTSQNNVTRADVTDDGTGSATSGEVGNFPVAITGVTDATFNRNFTSYTELQAANPVQLPVGDYTVTAHSNLTLQTIMSEPYYEGIENITISKDVQSSATVECTMKNTKIQLVLPTDFTAAIPTWTVTINDGTDNILTFDDSNSSPAAVYWLVSANVTTLNVEIQGTNLDGESIRESRQLTKPTGSSSNYWTGGDALTITFNATTPDPENPSGIQGSGIEISVDLEFDETGDTVEVPVTGGDTQPEDPGTGGGDEPGENPVEPVADPSISFPKNVYTLPADASSDATATILTPAGLQSVKVQIVAGNTQFAAVVSEMFGSEPFELVGNTTLESVFSAMGITLPVAGESTTEYKFPVQQFFTLLMNEQLTGGATTDPNGHVFNITVTDLNGEQATDSLSVIVE